MAKKTGNVAMAKEVELYEKLVTAHSGVELRAERFAFIAKYKTRLCEQDG